MRSLYSLLYLSRMIINDTNNYFKGIIVRLSLNIILRYLIEGIKTYASFSSIDIIQ